MPNATAKIQLFFDSAKYELSYACHLVVVTVPTNMELETWWLMFLCGLLALFLLVEGRGVLCRVGRRVGDGMVL